MRPWLSLALLCGSLLLHPLIAGCATRTPASQSPSAVSAAAPDLTPSLAHQLMQAAWDGDLQVARELIEAGADVNSVGWVLPSGEPKLPAQPTPLILATIRGHVDLVRLLLDAGADLHAQEDRALVLAISRMAWSKRLQDAYFEICKELLDRGASPNAQAVWQSSSSQYSALELAVRTDHLPLVRLLLEKGASVELRPTNLRREAEQKPQVLKLLVEHGLR